MTRKDFVLIADVISKIEGEEIRKVCAEAFAERLKLINPQFKADRFMKACMEGVEV